MIVALDLDCFYASVAIRARPHLKDKPVVIVQKHLCVTSNYVARQRAHGAVQKMTPVSKAKAACPDLVLIDGSDLTPFREANQQVVASIREWLAEKIALACTRESTGSFQCPCQKLGFDEVFIDLSRIVQSEMEFGKRPWRFEGHVFGRTDDDDERRLLMIASQLVKELRDRIIADTKLGLCAGISTSKLLAKLAVNMHKPNDQTIFLPSDAARYVGALPPRSLPGFGHATGMKLEDWANRNGRNELKFARDIVQNFGMTSEGLVSLGKILGSKDYARKILALCHGEDDAPVVDSGTAYKSITSMDSFRKCDTMESVRARVNERLDDLVTRLRKDWEVNKRRPRTLTVGYRFKGNGFHGSARAVPMPCEIVSLCSKNGAHVKKAAFSALQTASLRILAEHAGVAASKQFDLTWISIGASNFSKCADLEKEKQDNLTLANFFESRSQVDQDQRAQHRKRKTQEHDNVQVSKTEADTTPCPVCGEVTLGNLREITAHVDLCLRRGAKNKTGKKRRTSANTLRVDSFFSKQ